MANVELHASEDFWYCSRKVCAWPFCVRSTLLDKVARAESTGAYVCEAPLSVAAVAIVFGVVKRGLKDRGWRLLREESDVTEKGFDREFHRVLD